MDNGVIEVFTGYRVQYNITLGPAKGASLHTRVTLDRVTTLAGVDDVEVRRRANPVRRRQGRRHLRSDQDVEARGRSVDSAAISRDCRRESGPRKMYRRRTSNTDAQIMAWVMDTYSMHVGHTSTAVVTGKPIEMGGSLGRREATGRGVMIAARESARHVGLDIKGAKVAVQGFGNVGSISAELLASEVGASIVAVTDWKGGIFNAQGLDIPKLVDYVKQHKTVDGFPGGDPLKQADPLRPRRRHPHSRRAREPDHDRQRAAIKAKIIIEGRQRPDHAGRAQVPARARRLRRARTSSPTARGVTTSYFEWVQDRYGYFWTEKEVNERLEARCARRSTPCCRPR
jgi:glutamate dehydrogenase (NAD(P)+)